MLFEVAHIQWIHSPKSTLIALNSTCRNRHSLFLHYAVQLWISSCGLWPHSVNLAWSLHPALFTTRHHCSLGRAPHCSSCPPIWYMLPPKNNLSFCVLSLLFEVICPSQKNLLSFMHFYYSHSFAQHVWKEGEKRTENLFHHHQLEDYSCFLFYSESWLEVPSVHVVNLTFTFLQSKIVSALSLLDLSTCGCIHYRIKVHAGLYSCLSAATAFVMSLLMLTLFSSWVTVLPLYCTRV